MAKIDIAIERFDKKANAHWRAGKYIKNVWVPFEEFKVKGSFQVHMPTRRFPFGFMDHFYTVKYAKLLAAQRPDLYMAVMNINPTSSKGLMIMAYAVSRGYRVAPDFKIPTLYSGKTILRFEEIEE